MRIRLFLIIFCIFFSSCQTISMRQNIVEFSEKARPNDEAISNSLEGHHSRIQRWKSQNRLYVVNPKGNAVDFKYEPNKKSLILEKELSEGYILSYLFYENGVIKYNGKAKDGRFNKNINDETLFLHILLARVLHHT